MHTCTLIYTFFSLLLRIQIGYLISGKGPNTPESTSIVPQVKFSQCKLLAQYPQRNSYIIFHGMYFSQIHYSYITAIQFFLQSNPDISNLQGKLKKVRVNQSSSYRARS